MLTMLWIIDMLDLQLIPDAQEPTLSATQNCGWFWIIRFYGHHCCYVYCSNADIASWSHTFVTWLNYMYVTDVAIAPANDVATNTKHWTCAPPLRQFVVIPASWMGRVTWNKNRQRCPKLIPKLILNLFFLLPILARRRYVLYSSVRVIMETTVFLEWMNLFAWQKNKTISQAKTPRHDKCVCLPVSWINSYTTLTHNWLRS